MSFPTSKLFLSSASSPLSPLPVPWAALPYLMQPFWLPDPAPLTWPDSGLCSLWSLPEVPAPDYALSFIYNKPPPLYLGAIMFFLCIPFFHSSDAETQDWPMSSPPKPQPFQTKLLV